MNPLKSRSWQAIARDRLAERRAYGNNRSWLASLYDRVLSRLPRAPLPFRRRAVRVKSAGGQPLYLRLNTTDFQVLMELMRPGGEGDYEIAVRRDLGRIERIVDLGSNCGLSIRYWQEHFPKAQIVGVEPDSGNMEVCKKNVACGPNPNNVTLVEAFVGATARTAALNSSGPEWAFRMEDVSPSTAPEKRIPVVPIADILAQISGRPIDLLKMDIEGAEEEIMAVAHHWMHGIRNIIVEIHPPYTEEKFRKHMTAAGSRYSIEALRSCGQIVLFLLSQMEGP